MLYKITYADGRCHNYAYSRNDLLEWLAILKDEVITEIKKVAKNGKTEIVTDRYIRKEDKHGNLKPPDLHRNRKKHPKAVYDGETAV